jgi:hypothetical protein
MLKIPRLEDARCKGRWDLFDPPADSDPDDLAYANAAAAQECEQCPAMEACLRWIEGLPKRERPTGIVAGRVWVVERPATPLSA